MTEDYLLADGEAELERLRLQATVWERDADAVFDMIGVAAGWNCVDIGCGAMGVLRALSKRVGRDGRVLGTDVDARLLAAARRHVEDNAISNVTLETADVFGDALPCDSFDLVHLRFMLAPIGREADVLDRAIRLARPGGVVVLQEPDAASWTSLPPDPEFDRLKAVILDAFARGGGDFSVGRRATTLLRAAGLRDVGVRAAVQAMADGHPYMRLPCQFALSLRDRIIRADIMSAARLDALVESVDRLLSVPEGAVVTFTVIQAWGYRP